ncbi:conserved hypothetical protein [Klebsiella grimontii]|uniref:Uncharacterized protein n=1 Tax=Klebsiella grimontii TaxID=2058152 RepID=A0A285AWG3_9ENTR|nr:conserved hypothetical protein [Klebsiella grimontii]
MLYYYQLKNAAYINTLLKIHITFTALSIIACQPSREYSFARL